MIPRLALTPGEPAGIGPDLCIMLAQQDLAAEVITIADPDLLQRRAQALGLPLTLLPFEPNQSPQTNPAECIKVLPLHLETQEKIGTLDPSNASYVLDTLRIATEGCLSQRFDGLVTGPIHKGIINAAGLPFTGHTEFLAALCQTATPVMMLATEGLRVALVTTHLPLSQVSQQITQPRLEQVSRILHQALQDQFGITHPRILVCGLNPHAGEDGHLGREELEIIQPVLDHLREEGMDLVGPLSADTLFNPSNLENTDAVLAMYHDQGLPVLKHMGFGRSVNITLGLPMIRTSVDHGTALELAGTGKAQPGSLQLAVTTAMEMVANRKQRS